MVTLLVAQGCYAQRFTVRVATSGFRVQGSGFRLEGSSILSRIQVPLQ